MWVSEDKRTACADYAANFAQIDAAACLVNAKLDAAIRSANLKADSEARPKSKAGFFRKVSKLEEGTDYWSQVSDKIGCRVVVEANRDVSLVVDAIQLAGFSIVSKDDQRLTRDPRKLKYAGYHMQITHPDIRLLDGSLIECELQVRSRTLHAWSETEHRLVYKSNVSLDPVTLRRLERLLVFVELFDEELERGIGEVESMPEFALGKLLRELEDRFSRFVELPGDDEVSFEVLEILTQGQGAEDYELALHEVDDLIANDSANIMRVLAERGPESPSFDAASHWILSQPECLLIMALTRSKPLFLASQISGSDIENEVTDLINVW